MTNIKLPSIVSSSYERFFDNASPHPAASLLNAGSGVAEGRMNWWDTRHLWSHPFYGLVMFFDDCKGIYRNENGFECKIAAGDFLLTFPNFRQHYFPLKGQKWNELYVGFNGDMFDILAKHKIIEPQYSVWRLPDSEKYINRLRKILQVKVPASPQEDLRRALHFLEFLVEIISIASPVAQKKEPLDWFAEACHAITANIHEKPDWNHLASSFGMSYHTFRRYFRERAGISPLQYREEHRYKMAERLLAEDLRYSCHEIALILGFSGLSYFSQQFKKRYKISPLQYRKKHAKHRRLGG